MHEQRLIGEQGGQFGKSGTQILSLIHGKPGLVNTDNTDRKRSPELKVKTLNPQS